MIVKFPEWKEAVAAAGVLLSLLFVAYEIRQSTQVARAQARQELAASNQQWLILLSQDSAFYDLWNKAWQQSGVELTEGESSRARVMMIVNLRRLENVYFQYSEGLVGESALHSYGSQNSAIFQSARFKEFWITHNGRKAFDPEFVKFFEEQMGIKMNDVTMYSCNHVMIEEHGHMTTSSHHNI